MFLRILLSAQMVFGMYGYSAWGSHVPALVAAVLHTSGPILEMGCGHWSTPVLHAICEAQRRFLLSAESDELWLNTIRDKGFECSWHHFIFVTNATKNPENWGSIGNDHRWGCVFIDHAPGKRRVADIARMRGLADVLVIHDTDAACYGYEPLLSSFKYRYDYTLYLPQTTLVSDTIDVRTFFTDSNGKNPEIRYGIKPFAESSHAQKIEWKKQRWRTAATNLAKHKPHTDQTNVSQHPSRRSHLEALIFLSLCRQKTSHSTNNPIVRSPVSRPARL